MAMEEVSLWINGQKRSSSSKETFEVLNPFTRKVVSISSSATSQDCIDAIESAHSALSVWENTPTLAKRAIFFKAAELLGSERYRRKLEEAIPEETGMETSWAQINISGGQNNLREAGSLATQVHGETFPSTTIPGGEVVVRRIPYGAILAIAPWNAPITLAVRAIAIPMICGNTVVFKCSEVSPRSQAIIAEILHEAGLPDGVFNFLSISKENSPRLTAELIAHAYIRHINFTGSDRVGRILAIEAAKHLKPCVFELGGKAAAVVLNDANINDAARCIVSGSMVNSGQVCMSTERVIVQRGVAEAMIKNLTTILSQLKAGDLSDPDVKLSALFNEASAQNVVSLIREAKEEGAEVIVGDMKNEGSVVQPHILLNARPGMRAWDRESFGPMMVIAIVDTVDEAVAMANCTDYSLTGSLWTNNIHSGLKIAARIRAGCVSINGSTIYVEPRLSHVGLGGSSGYGRFDIDHFSVKQMTVVHPPNQQYPLAPTSALASVNGHGINGRSS